MSIDCAGCGSQCSLETLSSKRLWDGIEAYRADSSYLLAYVHLGVHAHVVFFLCQFFLSTGVD